MCDMRGGFLLEAYIFDVCTAKKGLVLTLMKKRDQTTTTSQLPHDSDNRNPLGHDESLNRRILVSTGAQTVGLVLALLLVFFAAAFGNWATMSNVGGWYQTLIRPSWAPPDWVFGPVWTVLYVMMAVSAWLVWRQDGWRAARRPLTLFLVQLALNSLWSAIFFGLRQPVWACVEIVVLWLAIAATLAAFWRRSRLAGAMLLPYLLWVTFATALNFEFARLNG